MSLRDTDLFARRPWAEAHGYRPRPLRGQGIRRAGYHCDISRIGLKHIALLSIPPPIPDWITEEPATASLHVAAPFHVHVTASFHVHVTAPVPAPDRVAVMEGSRGLQPTVPASKAGCRVSDTGIPGVKLPFACSGVATRRDTYLFARQPWAEALSLIRKSKALPRAVPTLQNQVGRGCARADFFEGEGGAEPGCAAEGAPAARAMTQRAARSRSLA